MTTTIRNHATGKTIALTVEQKARTLFVFDKHPELKANEIGVASGTALGCAYVCQHNGRVTLNCTCGHDVYGPRCAHRLAGNWWLEARNRAAIDVLFNPNNVQ